MAVPMVDILVVAVPRGAVFYLTRPPYYYSFTICKKTVPKRIYDVILLLLLKKVSWFIEKMQMRLNTPMRNMEDGVRWVVKVGSLINDDVMADYKS